MLYHSIYPANPWGHGGEKRTAQLAEILAENNIEVILFSDAVHYKFLVLNLFEALKVLYLVYGFRHWKSLKVFLKFWKHLAIRIPQLHAFFSNDSDIFIWESTRDNFYYLPYFAKKYGKTILAFPHNLESLVPGQKSMISGKISPAEFKREINVLKQCDKVYAISREETHLFRLFGINADYLPYYPTLELESHLSSIRERRKNRKGNSLKRILLLGSAVNPPTRSGMENRILFFKNNFFENIELIVGGYNTESLKFCIDDRDINVHFMGELSTEELEKELLKTDALLIHQPPTTGALTRIIEFIIAGIPVIVNEDSARSYFDLHGVYVYESDNKLKLMLSNWNLEIPNLPEGKNYNQINFNELYD
ncbi:MAG: glycosyltransferase [Paludibacter sp.]|nr:glycosyltransferase [Paludibacter sp.]